MRWIKLLGFFGFLLSGLNLMSIFLYAFSVDMVYENGSVIPYLRYDFDNETNYTSHSYKDASLVNPDAFLKFCWNASENESYVNDYVELAYASDDCSKVYTLLTLPPRVKNNCSMNDIDIASYKAFYPGYPYVLILNSSTELYRLINLSLNSTLNDSNEIVNVSNVILCRKLNTSFNGSYKLNVYSDDIKKTFGVKIEEVKDDKGRSIDISDNYGKVIIELYNKTNGKLASEMVPPKQSVAFNYSFVGGESVYVNGILSLKVIPFNPCGVINTSGYYMINQSSWNNNGSCVVIANASKVILNFANRTIDGDNNLNGSMANNSCGITIIGSSNVSLIDLRTEQFFNGLCIFNSSGVTVYGNYNKENLNGIYIVNSRSIEIKTMNLENSNAEVRSINTTVKLDRISIPSANFSLYSRDTVVKSVNQPPPQPSGLINISQWLYVKNTTPNSWAVVTFHYSKPLPHNVLEATLDLYKYDTNGTAGKWFSVPSYTDKIKRMIYSINVSNFSVFVPMGEEVNMTPKNPPPSPPTTGTIKQKVVSRLVPPVITPPKLELRLKNNTVRIQQGQSKGIRFNLTNKGRTVQNVMIVTKVRPGWQAANISYPKITAGTIKNGTIYLKVYDNEVPGTYYVNVKATVEGNMTVDSQLLKVVVLPRGFIPKLDIIEAPPKLTLFEKQWRELPVLVRNSGDYNLTNITMSFDYAEDCIEKINGSFELPKGGKTTLSFEVKAKKALKTCNAIMVLRANVPGMNETAIAFSPVVIEVIPKPGIKIKVSPFIFGILTAISLYILINKFILWLRGRKK